MGILSFLGFGKKKQKINEMLAAGAIILDVRTKQEFDSGHVKGSVNIPLDSLGGKIKKIKQMNKPVVACCASGMRSGTATTKLKQHGIDAINGGGWQRVNAMV